MEIIDILLIIFAVIASLSKIIDNVTTIRGYNRAVARGVLDPVQLEENSMGRKLFRRYGVIKTCWGTFVVWTAAICAVCAIAILMQETFAAKCVLIVIYMILTGGCISAGIYNTTGRVTIFLKMHRLMHFAVEGFFLSGEVRMETDEKYFEENALKLLDSFNDFKSLEAMDWQKLRKSFVQWQIKHGGGAAIADTAMAPLLDAGDIMGQIDLIRKCKSMKGQMFHSLISFTMADDAVKRNSGTSFDDAIYVVSTTEEYKLIEEHLGGGNVKRQSLVQKKGHPYDVVEVVKDDGSACSYYFDVADAMQLESLNDKYFCSREKNDDICGSLDDAYEKKFQKEESDKMTSELLKYFENPDNKE